MKAVQSVDDKLSELEKRSKDRKLLGQKIDRIILQAEAEDADGCAGRGLCPMLGRGLSRLLGLSSAQRANAVSTTDVELGSTNCSKARTAGSDVSRAVFGISASKKKTPASKLAAAGDAMRARVEQLDAKIEESRSVAQELARKGNKAAAMRELKRSKQLEKQAASTRSVMDAIDSQADMLEQTQLQREVAAALGATAKTLKKDKKILTKAEGAVEAANDVRDLHEDISSVMGELDTVSRDVDEDELMDELNLMINGPDNPGGSGEAVTSAPTARIVLPDEEQHKEAFDALEVVRRYPSVPKKKVGEKVGLLESTAAM